MSKLHFSDAAKSDFDGIWNYLSAKNRSAAIRLVERLSDKLELLADNPLLGETVGPDVPEMRRYTLDRNYVAYYMPGLDSVLVTRILHGARDAESLSETPHE